MCCEEINYLSALVITEDGVTSKFEARVHVMNDCPIFYSDVRYGARIVPYHTESIVPPLCCPTFNGTADRCGARTVAS